MTLSSKIKKATANQQLLNHPFYQDWNQGKLSLDTLKTYAGQYYYHVDSFPRYISATHSQCENINNRKILLENLMEEDGIEARAHIHLWADFCRALGYSDQELGQDEPFESIKDIIETFFESAYSSYEEGLAALYAYERQVPEVAETKIEGLKKFYNMDNHKALAFFEVHKQADIYHRKACEDLLDQIPEKKHDLCLKSAKEASQSLWNFLTEAHRLEKVA